MSIKHPFRKTFMTTHHICPKARCSSLKRMNHPSNKIRLWRDKHSAYHYIFGNQTFDEIVYSMSVYYHGYSNTDAWNLLFKDMPLLQVVRLIERTIKIKCMLMYTHGDK